MIQNEYETDLQERIVAEMRKTAKIDIKPMPTDFFPKAPTPTQGAIPEAATPKGSAPAAATAQGRDAEAISRTVGSGRFAPTRAKRAPAMINPEAG